MGIELQDVVAAGDGRQVTMREVGGLLLSSFAAPVDQHQRGHRERLQDDEHPTRPREQTHEDSPSRPPWSPWR